MSGSQDRERRPEVDGEGGERRRLRVLGHPDPFLVTKLPKPGTVAGGVVELRGLALFGFVQQPFPDGTEVTVGYQEWLYAERLPERSTPAQREDPVEPALQAAVEPTPAEAAEPVPESPPGSVPESPADSSLEAAAEPAPESAPERVAEPAPERAEEPSSGDVAPELTAAMEVAPQPSVEADDRQSVEPTVEPTVESPESQADLFPDDLRGTGTSGSTGERDGKRDDWTEAFRRRRDDEEKDD